MKPFEYDIGLTSMKLPLSVSLVFVLFSFCGLAQKQNPSFIHQNRIISYSITRYTPAWEIQPETHKDSELVAGSKLFRQVRASQTSALRAMMYDKTALPSAVSDLDDSALLDHWKRNRIRMYFRIKYKGYNVFLARLNDHNSRSIMPFKDVNGKWELDTEFMNEPLFVCLQDVNFDPFTGKFIGESKANLSFDGIENGYFIDYSSNDTKVSAKNVVLVSGRIGKCAKVDSRSSFRVPFGLKDRAKDFHIDCHLSIDESLNSDNQTLFRSVDNNGKGIRLSRSLDEKGVAQVTLDLDMKNGSKSSITLDSKTNTWFHLNISHRSDHLVVQVDGHEVGSVLTSKSGGIIVGDLTVGGEGSARFRMDELNIGF